MRARYVGEGMRKRRVFEGAPGAARGIGRPLAKSLEAARPFPHMPVRTKDLVVGLRPAMRGIGRMSP